MVLESILTSVNTRLLIQNMRLPTHDMFTTLLHDFMNLRIFCLQFASGEKKDLWIPNFWYKMWDCPPMFSRTLNSEYWIFSKSFDLFTTLLYDFTIFLFTICRWGKERPLNTRFLIQNVGLPTHDFTNSQFEILNFSDCFTISRFNEFSVYNLQVGKREATEYPTSDTKCGIAHPWHWLCTWSRGKRRNELG